jgi:hypothetical protein
MTNKKEVAQAVMKAYEEEDTYNFPKDGVVAALREVVNQLGYDNYHVDGDHGLAVVNVRDILKVCDELENL